MKCVVVLIASYLAFLFPSRADSIVVFNEVMYHPPSNEASSEWIELHNQNAVDVDISGWSLTGGVDYTFAEGTRVKGRGYLLIASDPATLGSQLGSGRILGPFSGRLGNAGERLELTDRNGRVMDSMRYGTDASWPISPDGAGVSLAKRDPNRGSERGENWTSSDQIGGTPGQRNFPSGGFEPPLGLVSYWDFETPGRLVVDRVGSSPGILQGSLESVSGLVGVGAVGWNNTATGAVELGRRLGNSLSDGNGFTLAAVIQPTWNGSGRATLFRKEADRRLLEPISRWTWSAGTTERCARP
jgi:Lamin Tail Domain